MWMRRHRSQTLVEFALVVPLFALLLFGLLDLARLVYMNNALAEAGREAARYGSVQARSSTVAGRAAIATRAQWGPALVPTPTVSVWCERNGSVTGVCAVGSLLVIDAHMNVTLLTPIVAQLVGPVPLGSQAKVGIAQ